MTYVLLSEKLFCEHNLVPKLLSNRKLTKCMYLVAVLKLQIDLVLPWHCNTGFNEPKRAHKMCLSVSRSPQQVTSVHIVNSISAMAINRISATTWFEQAWSTSLQHSQCGYFMATFSGNQKQPISQKLTIKFFTGQTAQSSEKSIFEWSIQRSNGRKVLQRTLCLLYTSMVVLGQPARSNLDRNVDFSQEYVCHCEGC